MLFNDKNDNKSTPEVESAEPTDSKEEIKPFSPPTT